MIKELSICIPTFNRVNSLRELIKSILDSNSPIDIEICISNNCSEDETKSFLDTLVNIESVKVYNQPHTVDIDSNMFKAISLSTKAFVYPLGDDDIIDMAKLNRELGNLDPKISLLVFNGRRNNKNLIPPSLWEKTLNEPEKSFQLFWDKMPFGSFLINSELIDYEAFKKYLGTAHAYSGMIWEKIYQKNCIENFVMIRSGKEEIFIDTNVRKSWAANELEIMFIGIPMWFHGLKYIFPCIEKNKLLKDYLEKLTSTSQLYQYHKNIPFFSSRMKNLTRYLSFKLKIKLHLLNSLFDLLKNLKVT